MTDEYTVLVQFEHSYLDGMTSENPQSLIEEKLEESAGIENVQVLEIEDVDITAHGKT